MRYSVLISVYKKDNPVHLKLALESIYDNQIRVPDEIVIVLDGPLTPKLYSVLKQFRHGKENVVNYCRLESNQGLGEALRIGSEHCTGDYIFRMDADDISDPRRFYMQIEYLSNHPEIDVLGSDIAEFDFSPNEKMRLRICPEKHNDIVIMGKRRSPMNHVTVCIKKVALDISGGYKPLLFVEDYYLWLRMIVAGCRFANIHETLVYVRTGDSFIVKRGSRAQIIGWRIIQQFMIEHHLVSRFEAVSNMIYINLFVRTPAGVKKVLYSKLLRKDEASVN